MTIAELLDTSHSQVIHLPALVHGELVWPELLTHDRLAKAELPPWGSVRLDGVQVIRRPMVDRASLNLTGDDQYVVVPFVEPAHVIEADLDHLASCLHTLPFDEVLSYFGSLRELLSPEGELVRTISEFARRTLLVDDRLLGVFFKVLPELFDPDQIGAAVDADLGSADIAGRSFLDDWVPIRGPHHTGAAARIGDSIYRLDEGSPARVRHPRLSAIPTRQLHITAGNAPVIAPVSLIRSLATKGASVIKSAADTALMTTVLAFAMNRLDPKHPLTHHTSLIYWRGGDASVEDVLLSAGSFDRVIVWGDAQTVASVRSRSSVPTIAFEPRVSLSLIGNEAFDADIAETVKHSCVDSMVENQGACTASLVHYVEGSHDQCLIYCRNLREALKEWDNAVPHHPSRRAETMLRRWRRNELVGGQWFLNRQNGYITSAVVYSPHPFDVSEHPLSRCIVVRRVTSLDEALKFVHRGVSTVAIYPCARWEKMTNRVAARGVTTIAPVGDTERGWAGMPHDGRRVLSELVNWTVA